MQHEQRMVIVDPETGEVIDINALSDRELDALHLHLRFMQEEYARLERWVWSALRERAIARGGLDGDRRRWVVRRTSQLTVTPEYKTEVE